VSAPGFDFEPQRVEKPWGHELIWALTDDYCGKLLLVRAGHVLSLQYHEVKDESWYVHQGRAELELGDRKAGERTLQEIRPGDCFRFPPGTVHRIRALEDTTIFEVSTPQLEDVVRLADEYGRTSS
jgi:mannose-6-phosphate isomerase